MVSPGISSNQKRSTKLFSFCCRTLGPNIISSHPGNSRDIPDRRRHHHRQQRFQFCITPLAILFQLYLCFCSGVAGVVWHLCASETQMDWVADRFRAEWPGSEREYFTFFFPLNWMAYVLVDKSKIEKVPAVSDAVTYLYPSGIYWFTLSLCFWLNAKPQQLTQ